MTLQNSKWKKKETIQMWGLFQNCLMGWIRPLGLEFHFSVRD